MSGRVPGIMNKTHLLKKQLLILALILTTAAAADCGMINPVTGAISDIGAIVTAPARIDRASIYPVAGVVGAGLVLYSLDGQLRHLASKNRTKTLNDVSKQAEKLGNGGCDLAIAGVGALAGYVFSDEKLTNTSILAAESFLAANAVGTAAKFVAGRSRPYTGDGKRMYHLFNFKTPRTSFPSGHTVSAFSVASVYAYSYDSWAVKAAAYGLASMVALQRVYADKHWASDVFFGAALGTATGRLVAAKAPGGEKKLTLLPVYEPGYSGATAMLRF